ncbi:MAG: hypothetical protein AAFR77_13015 [Cyanobacteria bacterium J06631_2]
MKQKSNTPIESWFIKHDSKLPIFGVDADTLSAVARVRKSQTIGVLVKLPRINGYTEILLSQTPAAELSNAQRLVRLELNIQQTVNLVLSEFDQGIVPTVSELQELLEEAEAKISSSAINAPITITF